MFVLFTNIVVPNYSTTVLINKNHCVNGNKMEKQRTIWDLWSKDLPVSFNKKEACVKLEKHWGITYAPVYQRLKSGRFDVILDLKFFRESLAIGFDDRRGFFFDPLKWEEIAASEQKALARKYKLSKKFASKLF